ncbi:12367_t:CDS:2 [Funneliformis geosporum]|uniref:Small ribosomal subunit protein mS29 n=1 Tax=Funneliformis geosporum TaxID=1117311 RepID=A0A9W4X3B3_9GLOM|nr:12367_t:CDS:2 [Funneliformis geosporum]
MILRLETICISVIEPIQVLRFLLEGELLQLDASVLPEWNDKELEKTVLFPDHTGSGKTTTLVVTGYFAKKSGCIVFPVQADKALLQKIPCQITGYKSLYEIANAGISNKDMSISIFKNFVQELQQVVHVPVIFLIDQCDALVLPHQCQLRSNAAPTQIQPEENPICNIFKNWDTFKVKRGAALFAFSSTFHASSIADDGSLMLMDTINLLTESDWSRLTDKLMQERCLPTWMTIRFHGTEISIRKIYMNLAVEYYMIRIQRLLDPQRFGKAVNDSSIFAAKLFMGLEM